MVTHRGFSINNNLLPGARPMGSILPFLFPHTAVICSLDIKNQLAAKNCPGHFKLCPKMEAALFLSPSVGTKQVHGLGIWLLNSDVRSCTEHLLFLKQYILTNYIINSIVIQNESHKD